MNKSSRSVNTFQRADGGGSSARNTKPNRLVRANPKNRFVRVGATSVHVTVQICVRISLSASVCSDEYGWYRRICLVPFLWGQGFFLLPFLSFICRFYGFEYRGSLKTGTRANFRWDFAQLQGSETQ